MTAAADGTGSGEVRAADAACRTLARLGVGCVFGLPGTQNLHLTEALRRSGLRWIVPSNELAAVFMANGHYRSSGRPGVVTTIPGPGFTWALAGLAEARLDSAAVLCLTPVHPGGSGAGRRLQEIPQAEIAGPLVKRIFRVASADRLPAVVERAHRAALAGEPGPVLVEIEHPVWEESCTLRGTERGEGEARPAPPELLARRGSGGGHEARTGPERPVRAVAGRLREAERPVLLVGQGAQEAAAEVRGLAEALEAPVLVTTSGRGTMSESHPLAVPMDALDRPLEATNRLLDASDLLLVLGCGLSHNATLGGRLRLPREHMVRVDASAEALEQGGDEASLLVRADVPDFAARLLSRLDAGHEGSPEPWWERGEGLVPRGATAGSAEPRITGFGAMPAFFDALRRAMPPGARLVTDSGLHQMLARRYFRVERPRTFVTPTNFQSMGFGIPAAVGAALAGEGRPTVALVGDGGLRLGLFELSTAASLELDLTVLVFVDGHFGLIRHQQLEAFGRGSGVDLPDVDLEGLAASLGISHRRFGDGGEDLLARCVEGGGVHLVEVPLEDAARLRAEAFGARLREDARHALGPGRMRRLRAWRDRWRGGDG